MAVSNIKAEFPCNIKRAWETVTSLEHYAWRSDLSRIEVVSKTQFIEYTADGFKTVFTVTLVKPCERWEFDMENENMKGHWTGVFSQKGEATQIDFTEDVSAKKLFMKPFVKLYLKKQQARYVADLRKALM